MSAPHHPAEPIWTSPPPGGPSGGRGVTAVVILAGLVGIAALVAVLLRGGPLAGAGEDAGRSGDPAGELDVPPPPAAGPPASPPAGEPTAEERLAELRASDRFVAFAEHERAADAWSAGVESFGWNSFAVIENSAVKHEWTNKAELWDEVVPPLRDELLLLGEPHTEPMWDEENPSPASIGARWNDESTGGRGQYLEMNGRYFDQARGIPVEIAVAVLVETRPDGSGRVMARMPPIELVPSQAADFRQSRELIRSAAWDWILRQPELTGA